MANFNNRVFGCAVVKAINSNYNADFSGQPRTLPTGVVYATDKAFKYAVKYYISSTASEEKIYYKKTFNDNLNPITLDDRYTTLFNDFPKDKKTIKQIVARNLLSCIDIRLFGATFAGKTNISIHGTVQVCHGVNIWKDNNIFTEQISSPFSTKSDDDEAEKGNTTLGRQSKLEEGHYMHHFSVNPSNINSITIKDAQALSCSDVDILKEAMKRGVTYYDSASKAGCENEMLVWVQLKEGSKNVLPNFTTLIKLLPEKTHDKCVYDFMALKSLLESELIKNDVESVAVSYNSNSCEIINSSSNWIIETIL